MNDCGNCRHTNHLGLPDWSTMPCAVCARFGADNAPTMWEAKPQTNADRIRAMTDEELAEFLWEYAGIDVCPPKECTEEKCDAAKCWLCWLKQEVKE